MELYLQFGHGMMEHSRHLVDAWGGGSAILSPRDLRPDQLQRMADDLQRRGGKVLLDPQFYLPHADHRRLVTHAYWPKTYEHTHSVSRGEWSELLAALCNLNAQRWTQSVILPGVLLEGADKVDAWTAQVSDMLEELPGTCDSRELLATIALGETAARDADLIHAVVDQLRGWPVDGAYVVCQPPRGEYLVTDPVWIANVLDLVAGVRLSKGVAILGYSSHQMLTAACAGATAIASGTWRNVRSFPPEKFRQDDDELRRRGLWYYCPQALSEYTVPYLDIAARRGILTTLRPEPPAMDTYVTPLFAAPTPSTAPFSDTEAFRHYLDSLARQARAAQLATFDATLAAGQSTIEQASRLAADLASAGIRGGPREFTLDVAQATSSALSILDAERGPVLRRRWRGPT
jgi:hypothetical protein